MRTGSFGRVTFKAAFFAALAATAQGALAQSITTDVSTSSYFDQDSDHSNSPGGLSVTSSDAGPGGGHAVAQAYTNYGHNAVYGLAQNYIPDPNNSNLGVVTVGGGASSMWQDWLTVGLGPDVESATMTVALFLDFNFAAQSGAASPALSWLAWNVYAGNSYYNYYADTSPFTQEGGLGFDSNPAGYSDEYMFLTFALQDGVPFSISSQLSCSAAARVGQVGESSNAYCNAANSAYWAGILNITDDAGNLLTDWTLASLSGTDYNQSFVPQNAVPEPSTWAMMLLGFGAVGFTMRRHRPRRLENAAA